MYFICIIINIGEIDDESLQSSVSDVVSFPSSFLIGLVLPRYMSFLQLD